MATKTHKTPAKADAPPLTMRLENGRLVCMTPYDAERLESYAGRPYVEVYIVAPMSRLRKKWEAIVTLAVKQCKTPWKNSTIARESIKLALDHVRLVDVNGRIERHAESLDAMNDAEFELFYEMSMLVLQNVTGVDPETLFKNSPYAGEDETSTGHSQSPVEQDGAVDPQLPAPSAETPDRGGSEKADGEPAAMRSPASHGREDRAKLVECSKKFMAAATDPDCSPLERKLTLEQAKDAWKGKGYVPDDFLRICYERGLDVVSGRMSKQDATRVLEALIP